MPYANLKVPAGTMLPESKKRLTDAVTEAIVTAFGEAARADTLVLLEEVPDGGWSSGGTTLTAAVLGRV